MKEDMNKDINENVDEVKDSIDEIKKDMGDLVEAAKKAGKTVTKVGVAKGKEVASKVKENASKVTKDVMDMFHNTKIKSVIQVNGMEIDYEEVVKKVKDTYALECPDGDEVDTLNLYIKPDDNAIYYVVNGKSAGKVDIL